MRVCNSQQSISNVQYWYLGILLQEQDYAKACFCCEELLLHNPHNHLYHQRAADIRYTMGGYADKLLLYINLQWQYSLRYGDPVFTFFNFM